MKALSGAFTAWLALIALQAVSTQGGSGRISSLFGEVDRLVERALDPTVPAIPDLRSGGADSSTKTPPAAPAKSGGTVTTPVTKSSTTIPRLPTLQPVD